MRERDEGNSERERRVIEREGGGHEGDMRKRDLRKG